MCFVICIFIIFKLYISSVVIASETGKGREAESKVGRRREKGKADDKVTVAHHPALLQGHNS